MKFILKSVQALLLLTPWIRASPDVLLVSSSCQLATLTTAVPLPLHVPCLKPRSATNADHAIDSDKLCGSH